MARYKYIDTSPRFLPVDLTRQLIPGTFEHAVHHLLTGAIDLSPFDARFRNDETGAPAYPPAKAAFRTVRWTGTRSSSLVLPRDRGIAVVDRRQGP